MKHRTPALVLLIGLCLCLLASSFGSSASTAIQKSPADPAAASPQASSDDQDEQDNDADLPADLHGLDKENYLRRRAEYVGLRRGIEAGRPFDPEARGRAIEQMERQEQNLRLESMVSGTNLIMPLGAGDSWTPLGPAPLPNGFGGAVSGRATSVVVDPTNSSKIYVGTAQGGVWRSLDGGASWQSIFDNAQAQAVGALTLAPSDPTILYVGTGEFNGCGDCFFGVGLYRIDTVDTTPALVGPINPQITLSGLTYNIFTGRSISKILVDPSNPATIFVATARGVGGSGANGLGQVPAIATRGVYRSTNATSPLNSITFQKLVVTTGASADSPGTGNEDISDIAIEPGNPSNLIAAAIGPSGSGLASGIYQSSDALGLNPTFTLRQSLPNNTRVNLAINKVGSVVTVYAATSEPPTVTPGCTSSSPTGAIRKSIDGGTTWSGQLTGGGGFCSGQCFYDMPIAVDPNDANVVYIGGQTSSTCGGVVRKSTDGGTSFLADSSGLHPDDHSLFFDGAGNIYTGNDGGVWKRSSSAAAGTAWTNLNNAALNTLQFESIAVHPLDRNIALGGTQDNGSELQQTVGGSWTNSIGGDGGYALIDQSATDNTNVTMYHTFFFSGGPSGSQIRYQRVTTLAAAASGSWTNIGCIGAPANGINCTDFVLFYAPMALGPGNPNTVYLGTDRLYRSNDRGTTNTVVSQAPVSIICPVPQCPPNPTFTSPVSTIAIWPGGDNYRIVGFQDGQVWGTSTGSSTLVNLTSSFSFPANPNGSPINKFVGRALIDPNNKNVAYVALSYYAPAGQGIWKITNLGAAASASPVVSNWIAAGSGIPSIPINALAIDPINSNILYAGTDIGVYYTTDAGANWNPYGTGLPRAAVFDLALQNANRVLRAGTHGRGIWEIPLITPGPSTVQFTSSSYSVSEGGVDAIVTITRSGDTSFPASVNYSTSDTAGSTTCGAPGTGKASSRCDYLTTMGTLQFAANETSKSISIPIVDDAYAEGSETFFVTLGSPGGSGLTLGSIASATITIGDNDASTGTNQIDVADFFVRQQYIDFLNREPDPAGRAFWVNNITSCGADPQCIEVKRIDTSAAFFLSIEFQQTGYLVYRIYKASYGYISNAPVPIRFNEFLPDVQEIGQGVVVNQGNWQQQLEDNKQAFTEEFLRRSRFTSAYPAFLTTAQFVDTMNANAGGPLSQAERDQLVADLNAGVKTRAQALRTIAEDPDLNSLEFNRAFVLMQYYGYLRRNPYDPPEPTLDYQGYNFWLNKLNQFGGNYVNAEMVKAFITSDEYRHRFGP